MKNNLKILLGYLLSENAKKGDLFENGIVGDFSLLENVDEAALRGFSLDILKKEMPEFKKQQYPTSIGRRIIQLVDSYKLPHLGSGSSRTVYALSTGKVLKIAINEPGIGQNEAEYKVSRDPSLKYIGARVYETDPDFHWSVMEVAQIYRNSTELKIDLGIPPIIAKKWNYSITKAMDDIRAITDDRMPLDELIYDEVIYGDKIENEEEEKEFRKFLEDPPKNLLALVDLTDGALGDRALEYGDIVPDHFGKTADGRPVLIDYGFTTGVMEDYYRDDSVNSYGSPPPSSIMDRDEEEIPRASQGFESKYIGN